MDLSRNEWGPGKDVLKLEAWGFYLFIYLCPALFKKDLRQLMKIHKVEQRRINGEAEGEGGSSVARAARVRRPRCPRRDPGPHSVPLGLSFSNFCQGSRASREGLLRGAKSPNVSPLHVTVHICACTQRHVHAHRDVCVTHVHAQRHVHGHRDTHMHTETCACTQRHTQHTHVCTQRHTWHTPCAEGELPPLHPWQRHLLE